MLIKILIGGLLIFMIFNLFRAMKIMLSDQKPEQNMSTYIGRRVLASVAIIFIIILAVAFGLIEPNPRPY
ncbi:MAG: DUF2909 domain-containing protein [Glaciecola sp.]